MTVYSSKQMHDACSLIKERFPGLAVLGIPWLHSINPREMSKRIESDFQPTLFVLLARIGIVLARGGGWFCRLFYIRWKCREALAELQKRSFDGLAKSWFVASGSNEKNDFYLGDLQKRLAGRDLSLLMLNGNVEWKGWSRFLNQATKVEGLCSLPDLSLVSPLSVWVMVGRQIQTAFRLFFATFAEKDPLVLRVLKLASCDSLRLSTTLNALYFWVGKRGAQIWKPKFFVTLYEGHGWEECLWQGIRSAKIDCKVVGYQHTVIMGHSFDVFEPRKSRHGKTTPDVVLACGHRTGEIMKPGHDPFGTTIVPFGSFRYSPQMQTLKSPDAVRKNILVIPEGIPEEAIFLFNVVARMAPLLPDYRFILRCHPVLPFEKVRPLLEKDPTTFENAALSELPRIEDDFARCGAVLYRGSSAVLYGILMGLKPFYIHNPTLKMIDPLFELKEWREFVASEAQLPEMISEFFAVPLQKRIDSWQSAAKYVQEYTLPVDDQSVSRLLSAIG